METVVQHAENEPAPERAGGFKSALSVGCGLALGALAGIVVGLVAGVGLAMILAVL